jgi:hypothetical protein
LPVRWDLGGYLSKGLALGASRVPKQFSSYFPNLDFLRAFGYAIAPMVSVDVFEGHTAAVSDSSATLHRSISGIATESVSPVVTHGHTISYLHVVYALIHFPRCFPNERPDHFGFGK